jgi:hypothetical protein
MGAARVQHEQITRNAQCNRYGTADTIRKPLGSSGCVRAEFLKLHGKVTNWQCTCGYTYFCGDPLVHGEASELKRPFPVSDHESTNYSSRNPVPRNSSHLAGSTCSLNFRPASIGNCIQKPVDSSIAAYLGTHSLPWLTAAIFSNSQAALVGRG